MIITILSIALLVIATASTLSAFDGKKDGRITTKGWIALGFVILTFGVGASKEIYTFVESKRKDAESALKTKQDQDAANARQSELTTQLKTTQDQLELANAKLEIANTKLQLAGTQLKDLKGDLKKTQDQITGGSGFPVAMILALVPDVDGSFPLWVSPYGDAPMFDVYFKLIEGPVKQPTPEEMAKIQQQGIAFLTGHGDGGNTEISIGTLEPRIIVPLAGSRIHPSTNGVSTYRIYFRARNTSVSETMEVRFNSTENIWQYRYEVKSADTRTPNKLLVKEDWQPKKRLPMLYGNGPPHNR